MRRHRATVAGGSHVHFLVTPLHLSTIPLRFNDVDIYVETPRRLPRSASLPDSASSATLYLDLPTTTCRWWMATRMGIRRKDIQRFVELIGGDSIVTLTIATSTQERSLSTFVPFKRFRSSFGFSSSKFSVFCESMQHLGQSFVRVIPTLTHPNENQYFGVGCIPHEFRRRQISFLLL